LNSSFRSYLKFRKLWNLDIKINIVYCCFFKIFWKHIQYSVYSIHISNKSYLKFRKLWNLDIKINILSIVFSNFFENIYSILYIVYIFQIFCLLFFQTFFENIFQILRKVFSSSVFCWKPNFKHSRKFFLSFFDVKITFIVFTVNIFWK